METLTVNLGGLIVIGLIVWWFWLSSPGARRADTREAIEILVDDSVYTPATIEVPVGQPVTLRFLRKDPSPCAEQVVFDALGVSAALNLDEPRDIELTLPAPGEYEFTCQMKMYRGRLIAA